MEYSIPSMCDLESEELRTLFLNITSHENNVSVDQVS